MGKQTKSLTDKTQKLSWGYVRSNASQWMWSKFALYLLYIVGVYFELDDKWNDRLCYSFSNNMLTARRNHCMFGRYYRTYGDQLVNTCQEGKIIARWRVQLNSLPDINSAETECRWFIGIVDAGHWDNQWNHPFYASTQCSRLMNRKVWRGEVSTSNTTKSYLKPNDIIVLNGRRKLSSLIFA